MSNPTSMESSSGSATDLQDVRRGCVTLGRQAEDVAELVIPLLRLATQELGRLETQREELRKTAREAPLPALSRLTERIEEQGQNVKRLERASRSIKELISGLGGLGERLQSGLARHEESQRELEAITREEKRMWLRELTALREQHGGGQPGSGQQEEFQRLRAENEAQPRLRAERDRLAHRVTELEKALAEREQTLVAKEQTIEDLRRMIVLLTGDAAAPKPEPTRLPPPPVSVVPVTAKAPPPPASSPKQKSPDHQMFGNNTMQLANSMLETLGEAAPVSSPPVDASPPAPPSPRVPSMEIMLGPLDELEAMPPSLPPPIPVMPPVPSIAAREAPGMPRASARSLPFAPAMTPAPVPSSAPRVHGRPGTLVISEDMFNDMLVEEKHPGGSGKK
jgi:hypothetical protein